MARAGLGLAIRQLRGLFGGGSVVGLEDSQLLARYASNRDEAAFEALIERHGSMVLTICRAVLKNEHDSEDAFQATFLVLARRAGSIRTANALGGWLHRVAYRASVQASLEAAKRRRNEAQAHAMAAQISRKSTADSELQALVHDEIDRLPESQRLAIVLCDLEGLTYEQAATQLHWTVPTLRNRLARGRQRLKTRLTHQGLTAPALVGLASVPPSLLRSTLSAATGGAASAEVALLARILMKGMFMTKLKIAGTSALAVISVISVGVIAAGSGKFQDEPKPVARAEIVTQETKKPNEPSEVRGIVLNPDGKPVAGAKVWAYERRLDPETTSGPDGRFVLQVSARDPSRRQVVAASAPGFGLGWTRIPAKLKPSDESMVQLVPPSPPIEGRILDSKNQPVAGAIVKVKYVWVADQSSFADWTARVKAQEVQSPSEGLTPVGFKTPIEARTRADGRFRMTGIGHDRNVTLVVSGPNIATTEVNVLTHDGPELQTTPRDASNAIRIAPSRTTIYKASRFDLVAGSSRPIEGTVRDKDTGRPIAGLLIRADVVDHLKMVRPDENVQAKTDAEGRYRLEGMPFWPAYHLFISRPQGQNLPYARSSFMTDSDLNSGPISFDIALPRAVVIRGRVTDKTTGRPVAGTIDPYIFAGNTFDTRFAYAAEPRQGIVATDEDGRFEVVMPRGRGLITFLADRDDYLTGVGAAAIKGYDPEDGQIATRGRVCLVGKCHVVAEVNLDPKAESATIDLQVDPGRSLDLTIIDPEGSPIDGLRVEGTSPRDVNFVMVQNGSTVKVRALDPSNPRWVTVFHDGRKLVGSVWLKGDEVGPLTVRLGPWGSVIGRFIDAGGKGLGPWRIFPGSEAPAKVEDAGRLPGSMSAPWLLTDPDGRFRIDGLVPGLKYSGQVAAFMSPEFTDVIVNPGEVKDLGEIKAWWRKSR